MSAPASIATPAVSPGAGATVWLPHSRMTIHATADTTGGAYGLVESWVAPGAAPPLHAHHLEDEEVWVLSGRLSVRRGDEHVDAGPGDQVFLPRHVPHTFTVQGDAPARLVTVLSPGGGEGLVIAAGRLATGPGLPPVGAVEPERLHRLAPVFGLEVLASPRRTAAHPAPVMVAACCS